jgi:hypothetical protein
MWLNDGEYHGHDGFMNVGGLHAGEFNFAGVKDFHVKFAKDVVDFDAQYHHEAVVERAFLFGPVAHDIFFGYSHAEFAHIFEFDASVGVVDAFDDLFFIEALLFEPVLH